MAHRKQVRVKTAKSVKVSLKKTTATEPKKIQYQSHPVKQLKAKGKKNLQ